jgi:hypothetical protein
MSTRTRQDMAADGREAAAQALFGRDPTGESRMGFEDYEDGLCDALTNLMHFADRYGCEFDDELDRARRHHAVESTYDWEEEPGLDPKEVSK